MKALLIAALCAALLSGTALAGTTIASKHYAKIKRHHHHVTTGGYYKPGIPRHDPGRYSNLPGKDADYSKAYIRDH